MSQKKTVVNCWPDYSLLLAKRERANKERLKCQGLTDKIWQWSFSLGKGNMNIFCSTCSTPTPLMNFQIRATLQIKTSLFTDYVKTFPTKLVAANTFPWWYVLSETTIIATFSFNKSEPHYLTSLKSSSRTYKNS